MKTIPAIVSVVAMASALLTRLVLTTAALALPTGAGASGAGAGTGAAASSVVSVAVRDLVTSLPGERHHRGRGLGGASASASPNEACAREAEALDECTTRPTSLSDSAGPWADCVVAAYLDAHASEPTTGAGGGSTASSSVAASDDDAACDALRKYLCSPVDACPALASCVDTYNPYADCLMTAEHESLALLCNVTCESSSSSSSPEKNKANGSSGRRTEPSESASGAQTKGTAGMIQALVVAVGVAAHAFL
jgi:hypothetical protein